jgi:hypothetical protein
LHTGSTIVKVACTDMLQKRTKKCATRSKRNSLTKYQQNQVSIKSPVEGMLDGEWKNLVKFWSTPRHKVFMYICLVFLDVFASMFVLLFTYTFLISCLPICKKTCKSNKANREKSNSSRKLDRGPMLHISVLL